MQAQHKEQQQSPWHQRQPQSQPYHNHKHNIAIHAVILRKAISCPELLSLDALVLGLLAVTSCCYVCYVVRLSKHENSKALTLNASDIEPTEAVLATVSKSTIPAVSFANLWMVNHIAQQVVECPQSQTVSKIRKNDVADTWERQKMHCYCIPK